MVTNLQMGRVFISIPNHRNGKVSSRRRGDGRCRGIGREEMCGSIGNGQSLIFQVEYDFTTDVQMAASSVDRGYNK